MQTISRFRIFALLTWKQFVKVMGKDANVMKKTQTQMTQGVTGAKFLVCESVKSQ